MSEESAFLEALAANPEDDATRLVYADWLEERGSARGAYLRREVELAGLTESDARYAGLEEELQKLRPTIDPLWLEAAARRYDVWLHNYDPVRKIAVIKVVRELKQMGLKEAKDLSEALPAVVLRGVDRPAAERARDSLRAAADRGLAGAELRPAGGEVRLPPPPNTLEEHGYRVVVRGYPPSGKIAFVLALRRLTGQGLAEARESAERPLPAVVANYATRPEAEAAARELSPAATVEVAGPESAGAGPFALVLRGYAPEKKIAVIKLVRELTGMGLRECKELAEGRLPVTLRAGLAGVDARLWLRRFEGHGDVAAVPEGA